MSNSKDSNVNCHCDAVVRSQTFEVETPKNQREVNLVKVFFMDFETRF